MCYVYILTGYTVLACALLSTKQVSGEYKKEVKDNNVTPKPGSSTDHFVCVFL